MTLHLPEFDEPPAEPIKLLRAWITTAEQADVREPRAATLATADPDGRVASRTVLIKDISDDGPVLGFASDSRKGRDVTANPHASLNFYWRERAQQITINGVVCRADDATCDALFAGRPRPAQALATLSQQSEPVADLDRLRTDVDHLAAANASIRRPATWSAWLIAVDEIEFWHGSTDRFHRRLHYRRRGDHYAIQRLQP